MNAENEFSWFDDSAKGFSEREKQRDLAFSQLGEFAQSLLIAQSDYMNASNQARKMGIISEEEFDMICKKIYSNKHTKSYWETFQA